MSQVGVTIYFDDFETAAAWLQTAAGTEEVIAVEVETKPVEQEAKPVEQETKPEEPTESAILVKAKAVALAAMEAHGNEFITEVMELFPSEPSKTLNQNLAAMPEAELADFIETVDAGPDEPEAAAVNPEQVKTILRQFAKDKGQPSARGVMKEHSVRSMTAIDNMAPDALSAFHSALTAE